MAPRRAATHGLVFAEPPRRRRASPPAGPAHVAPSSHRPHGTRAKYVAEECRCPGCRAANTDYARERDRARHRPDGPGPAYVPAGRVREHLCWLRDEGVGLRRVAEVSGVSRSIVSNIVHQRQRRLRPETGQRILAVGPRHAASASLVDAAATWALIDQLVAQGHTRAFLAAQLGSRARVPALQLGTHQVRASTARAVEDLHRRLLDQRGIVASRPAR